MKSAYELAMERLSKTAPATKLNAAQKAELAELDSIYAAKLAQADLSTRESIQAAQSAGDAETVELLRQRYTLGAEMDRMGVLDKMELLGQNTLAYEITSRYGRGAPSFSPDPNFSHEEFGTLLKEAQKVIPPRWVETLSRARSRAEFDHLVAYAKRREDEIGRAHV